MNSIQSFHPLGYCLLLLDLWNRQKMVYSPSFSSSSSFVSEEFLNNNLPPFLQKAYLCPQSKTISDQTLIYSFGVILAEILTGKPPAVRNGSTITFISEIILNPAETIANPCESDPWPADGVQLLRQLSADCLISNPLERPDWTQVIVRLRHILDSECAKCVICLEAQPSGKLPCGHFLLCNYCVNYLVEKGSGCPLCRSPLVKSSTYFVPWE